MKRISNRESFRFKKDTELTRSVQILDARSKIVFVISLLALALSTGSLIVWIKQGREISSLNATKASP